LLAKVLLALQNSLQAVLLAMQCHHLSIKTLHINLHVINNHMLLDNDADKIRFISSSNSSSCWTTFCATAT